MHEVSIAQSLSEIVLQTASENKLLSVTKVNVTFGSMVQIVPGIFEFAFREAVRDSIAEFAEIHIEIVAVKLKCRKCGTVFKPGNDLFTCPDCKSGGAEIVNGRELFIKSIEGE